MKALICTDTHTDLISESIPRNTDIDKVMNGIIDRAIEEEVDYFLFLGDWCTSNKPSVEANRMLTRWFVRLEEAEIQTIWLIGNHDVSADGSHNISLVDIKWEYIKVIEDYYVFEMGEYTIVCLPYISSAKIKKLYNMDSLATYYLERYDELPNSSKKIVLSHLDIIGAKQGSELYMVKGKKQDMPQEIIDDESVVYILQGHYHSPQKIGTKIYCPGSPEVNNFGERNDVKGYYIMEM